MINIEDISNYCLSKKGVTPSFPFDEKTLVFKVVNKMFLLTGLTRIPFQINLKCDPEWALELRENYQAIIPGYHMSKKHWNTILINDLKDNKLLLKMIDHSYDLVIKSCSKKIRKELERL